MNLRSIRKAGDDSIAERFGAVAEMREAGMIRHLCTPLRRKDVQSRRVAAVSRLSGPGSGRRVHVRTT